MSDMAGRLTALTFPCTFPLKAIGTGLDGFEAFVVSIVRRHVAEVRPEAVASRSSSGGKYLAVTVTFIAESQDQLDAIYQELQAHERVVMVL